MIDRIGRVERPYLIIVATLLLAGALALLDAPVLLRVPFGIIAILIPGVALVLWLGSRAPLSGSERWLFAVGGSIASVVLSGVGIHALRLQLSGLAWVVAIAVLLARGLASRMGDDELPRLPSITRTRGLPFIGLAIILVAVSFATARLGVAVEDRPQFTELWLVPTATAKQYAVGIQSQETHTQQFRLELALGADPVTTVRVLLRPGESWSSTVDLPDGQGRSVLHARLYREGQPTIYRQVFLRPATDGAS